MCGSGLWKQRRCRVEQRLVARVSVGTVRKMAAAMADGERSVGGSGEGLCRRLWRRLFRANGGAAGCCLRLRFGPEEAEQRWHSQQIDKSLERDKRLLRRQVKVLLLGAGESGKSTFLKQMRIIHGVRFEAEVVREFQLVVYQNVVRGMRVLLDARQKLGIPWTQDRQTASQQHQERLLALALRCDSVSVTGTQSSASEKLLDTRLFLDLAPSLRALWEDPAIRLAFHRRNEYQLSDSVGYFLDNLDRIAQREWLPSNQDILHARKATKRISEFVIHIQGIPFHFVDVGGQRSQRQKWFQCFESVTSVLFLVSSSEYDQVILEDRKTKRLDESRNIFDAIVNNRFFRQVSLILFLNKMDLLAQKVSLGNSCITWYYPEFKGDASSLEDVKSFVLRFFLAARKDPRQPIFHHFTTAVDTENIKVVFAAVKSTILQRNLETLMLQ